MREIRSYGSVGERGGDEPLYPEVINNKENVLVVENCLKVEPPGAMQ